ncbi:hypothetical protein L1987_08803 [Smallanthus sonchifolius]|uniref:Uncharacterized protein n=1 Tax=Smallanthus sonchifolius TaxID=185202 RepID=A0ACB9JM64_9ASTR|nr:hypothetical protein L1987_08803 [Smallanthus sonchifolius]
MCLRLRTYLLSSIPVYTRPDAGALSKCAGRFAQAYLASTQRHPEVGIFSLTRKSKSLVLSRTKMNRVFTRRQVGASALSLARTRRKWKRVPYASAIGFIMYAMLCTRPDVLYDLSMTRRYQQNPGESHWIAVKNILKYLRRTKDMFLIYGGLEEELAQSVVAQPTTESEYIAASAASKEAAWMKKFIADLGVMLRIQKPIEILCDNTGAIAQAKEPMSHHSTKHILRRFHYIRDIIERGDVMLNKVHTY